MARVSGPALGAGLGVGGGLRRRARYPCGASAGGSFGAFETGGDKPRPYEARLAPFDLVFMPEAARIRHRPSPTMPPSRRVFSIAPSNLAPLRERPGTAFLDSPARGE